MSLLRLLTAGKSLVGLDKAAGRYRMHPHFLLPKFGSNKNPFADPAPAQPARAVDVAAEAPVRMLSPAEIAAANLKETKRLPAAVSVAPPTTDRTPAPVADEPGRIGRWAQKINLLAWWRRRRSSPPPSIPRFARVPLQGELSLDNVRVVRNDLSDADVEIVPARPEVESPTGAVAKARPEVGLLKI